MFSSTSGRRTTPFRTRKGADVSQTSGTGYPEEELDISDDCPKQTSSNESAAVLPATSGPDQMTSKSDVRSSNKSSPGHLQETSSPTCDVGESADLQAIADSRIVEFFVKNKIPVQVIMFSGKFFFTFLSVFWIIIFYIFLAGYSVLANPLSLSPIIYRYFRQMSGFEPRDCRSMFLGHPDPLVRHRDPDPSFYHEAKIVRKTLIPVLFATFYL
jgi:hypothetical protein